MGVMVLPATQMEIGSLNGKKTNLKKNERRVAPQERYVGKHGCRALLPRASLAALCFNQVMLRRVLEILLVCVFFFHCTYLEKTQAKEVPVL